MEHCSYRQSNFYDLIPLLNVFCRVTPFKQAQTSLFLTQYTYLILLHSLLHYYTFLIYFFHLTSIL